LETSGASFASEKASGELRSAAHTLMAALSARIRELNADLVMQAMRTMANTGIAEQAHLDAMLARFAALLRDRLERRLFTPSCIVRIMDAIGRMYQNGGEVSVREYDAQTAKTRQRCELNPRSGSSVPNMKANCGASEPNMKANSGASEPNTQANKFWCIQSHTPFVESTSIHPIFVHHKSFLELFHGRILETLPDFLDDEFGLLNEVYVVNFLDSDEKRRLFYRAAQLQIGLRDENREHLEVMQRVESAVRQQSPIFMAQLPVFTKDFCEKVATAK
jgi:hypothetical protein